MARFRQIDRGGPLPDLIAAQIMAQLRSGELREGDALPTETALAGMLGVSRNVVREAIARLRSDGVIDTRQGRGAVIRPLSERATFRIDTAALGSIENLADLFELRGLLEIDAAGIAARRRSDTDLAAMEAAIDAMAGASEFDELQLEADARFHRSLGQATRNGYLSTIIDYLSSRLKETTRATGRVYTRDDLIDVTIGEHRRVFDAVKSGDAEAARAAMAGHIRGAAARLGVPLP